MTWRFGFNLHWLNSISLISSSACVRRSRGNSNLLAMIHDQSCLNMIPIESGMQGDHKELTNFLQNCLIASRFNRKLVYKEKEHLFIEKFVRKTRTVRFGEGDWTAEIARFWWATIPRLPIVSPVRSWSERPYEATCRSISHRVHDYIATIGSYLNHDWSTCLDDDRVDRNPPD